MGVLGDIIKISTTKWKSTHLEAMEKQIGLAEIPFAELVFALVLIIMWFHQPAKDDELLLLGGNVPKSAKEAPEDAADVAGL